MPGERPRRDHYAVLGVDPAASARQITTAYRRLVRSLHPDAHPGRPPEDFTDVVAAYETLHDPERRAAYDAERARDDRRNRAPTGRPVPVRVTRATDAPARRPPTVRPYGADRPFDRLEQASLRVGPVRVDLAWHGQAADGLLDQIVRWMWGRDRWR